MQFVECAGINDDVPTLGDRSLVKKRSKSNKNEVKRQSSLVGVLEPMGKLF